MIRVKRARAISSDRLADLSKRKSVKVAPYERTHRASASRVASSSSSSSHRIACLFIFPSRARLVVSMPRDSSRETKPWSAEEDAALLMLQREHGNKWSEIGRAMGTRTGQQCAQRWRHKVNPSIRRERWTEQEDEMVRESTASGGCKSNKGMGDCRFQSSQRVSDGEGGWQREHD